MSSSILGDIKYSFSRIISVLITLTFRNLFFNKLKKKIDKINNIKSKEESLKKFQELKNNNSKDPYFVSAYGRFLGQNYQKKLENEISNFDTIFNDWSKKENLNNIRYFPIETVIGSFGNYLHLYYYLLNNFIFSKSQAIKLNIRFTDKINNGTLLSLFQKYISVNRGTINYFKEHKKMDNLTVPNYLVEYNTNFFPYYIGINKINQKLRNLKTNNPLNIGFTRKEIELGHSLLKKIGINENDWFVTLHIRETKDNHSYLRDADPSTYAEAIKKIIDNGGKVVRVGDRIWKGKNLAPFNKINGLIDYPFTNVKSEFMDIFLASKCKFCIGTSSGYWTVPMFFEKPVLLTNYYPPIHYFYLRDRDFFLAKNVFKKKTGEKVNFRDLISKIIDIEGNIDLNQYFIENNSSQQILNATTLLINSLNKNSEKISTTFQEENSFIFNSKLKFFAKLCE